MADEEAIRRKHERELGVPRVELRVRRLEAELGEKTGRVRLEGTRYVVAVASGKGASASRRWRPTSPWRFIGSG